MRAVAYCRVSTNKEEQLDSMESQRNFFTVYAEKNNYELIKIYADEGKSGTKMKNRTELLKLLSDADKKLFDVVLIKDASRLARNTIDSLTSLRQLEILHVKVIFVNYENMGDSNLIVTMFGALAQEESANTSKRIKFGKKQNAEKGRVPNIVYGYDKTIGEYYNLNINRFEANIVRRIFSMYINDNYGANKISLILNKEGIRTKRDCKWTQNAISRILTNKIYIGKIINGKEEVESFLTGQRVKNDRDKLLITDNPSLRIVEDIVFNEVQLILGQRKDLFKITGKRRIDKYPFSKLIKCSCCGCSFRRLERTYVNTFVRWVCSGRNSNGTDSCPNKTTIDEAELLTELRNYFLNILKDKNSYMLNVTNDFIKNFKSQDENKKTENVIISELDKLRTKKNRYIELYTDGDISKKDYKDKLKGVEDAIVKLDSELHMLKLNIDKSDLLSNKIKTSFSDMEKAIELKSLTNEVLNKLIDKITVDEDGKIEVFLKPQSDIGLENPVLISDNRT